MLRQAKDFKNFKLRASDGDIGKAREFYFDDKHWAVRYLVAETGGWLNGRQILISPYALKPVIEAEQVVPVKLTKKQIEDSPLLYSHLPVSRRYEIQYYDYYGWPQYWVGPHIWGQSYSPAREFGGISWPGGTAISPVGTDDYPAHQEIHGDPHLRSTLDVTGHHLQAVDGEIGHVEDFIIDDVSWAIRYLVVNTKNWWPGKHVLIAPQWIERVSWAEEKVFVNLERELIKGAPAYTPTALNREYELQLYRHYGRFKYWADEPVAQAHLKANNLKHHNNQHQQSSNGESKLDPIKIQQRAYELYVEHGSIPGNDLQDWLWAERELAIP
jgi:hypothetical protein